MIFKTTIFRLFTASAAGLLLLAGCSKPQLLTGTWRGALVTASGNEIPFNFEIADTAGKKQITIFNGTERFKVTDINVNGDSVAIKMPLFESEFKLKLSDGTLSGHWIKHLADSDAVLNFNATHGVD